jgi:hypothetical protein
MGIANIDCRTRAARTSNAPGGLRSADRVTGVRRPYTAFERGGIYRFSPGNTGPRLFHVA